MYTTYTIGEMARILGITAETIRYYERKNIIHPLHSEVSGYRYYTTWDLHMIIRARCYLGFGFTIEQVSDILQKESIEKIDDVLSKQEAIIQENIIYQMNLLKKLRKNRGLINDLKNETNQLTIRTRPGIYRIDTQKCYTLILSREEQEALKDFCQKVPFIFSTALFPKEHIEKHNTDFYFGVGVEEEFAAGLNIQESKYVKYYPPCNCLYMCISSRSSQFLTYQVMEPAFNYMKEHNLSLAGDIITQIVSMCKPEQEYFNWHNIWIPIE
ncbi:MerR family transcriptional regulator [Thomasclavelia sp.]|uniref:MerR family transcriptional regulator n=1 Tax=Thomasclavelia sp. TaxID=3025757 RepID=UPI0025DCA560|nr:MerR family transcriptional regulator [Thomasclavelia sp.]